MHIGFITLESPFDAGRGGGIAAYLRAIIPGLLQAGHRVTIIANGPEKAVQHSYGEQLRVINIRLPSLHWYLAKIPLCSRTIVLPLRQLEWSLKFYRAARSIFQNDPADVIESAEVGALLLPRRLLTPLVIRLHGSDHMFRKHSGGPLHIGSRWNHRLERAVWKRAQALTSPSAFQAGEVARELGWAQDRVFVIPNPIAPAMLEQAMHDRHRDDDRTQTPIVLYTGRLAQVKGIRPLLEAVQEVRKRDPRASFVLAGPWQMPERPEHWGLRQHGTAEEDGVSWLGHVPWHKLADWYRWATIFVMPSYYETFGISCLEAMAFDLPVVATTAGGLPEVVEHGVTGILVPPGDSQRLSEAIVSLLQDRDLRMAMGQAGRERVLAKYTADRVVEQTLAMYQKVIGM